PRGGRTERGAPRALHGGPPPAQRTGGSVPGAVLKRGPGQVKVGSTGLDAVAQESSWPGFVPRADSLVVSTQKRRREEKFGEKGQNALARSGCPPTGRHRRGRARAASAAPSRPPRPATSNHSGL